MTTTDLVRRAMRPALVTALALAAGAGALAAQQVGADSVGRLMAPGAVQERAVTTDRDNSEIVKAIEHRLRCNCGCNLDVYTCRTTDFTCTTSPAMHREVLARLDSNMTADQVVQAFEAQYGEVVLMEPPKRGFNWAAYIMPFIGLGFGLALVTALMRRWMRRGEPVPAAAAATPTAPPSGDDMERLRRELERFEA